MVVDSGASVHMLSRKRSEFNGTGACSSIQKPYNNEEVRTNEEATAYVCDFDWFVTIQIMEDTPAVLSLRKLCEDHGYSCELTSRQKPHLVNTNGTKIQCSTENYVPVVVQRLNRTFQLVYGYILNIGTTGLDHR